MPSTAFLMWVLTRSLFLPHEPVTLPLVGPGDLPAGTSVGGLIETAIAAVTSDRFDASGAGLGVPARIGAYGGSWTETTYRIGDLEATNPLRPGTAIVLPDSTGFRGVSIASFGSDTAVSTPGVRVTIDPMRPAERRSFEVEGVVTPTAWAPDPSTPPAIAALHSLGGATFLFSGPLSNRVGGVMGLHWADATHIAGEHPTEASASMVSGMAHLVATLRPHEELRTLVLVQQAAHPVDGWQALGDTTRAKDRMGLAHVTWERSDPDRLGLRISGGYQRALLDAGPPAALPRIDSVVDGDVLPLLLQPAGTTSSFRGEATLSRRPSSQDRHRWQIGATFGRHAMQPQLLAAPGAVETVNGTAARVWVFDAPASSSTWHQYDASVYGRDEIQLGSRLRLDASVRFESLHGSNGSAGSIGWHNIYPRAFATLVLAPDAGLSVFAAVSQSGGPIPPLALGLGDPHSPSARVYRWIDTNLDGEPQPAEYGVLVARVGPGAWAPGATAIDANLRRPLYTESMVGVAVDRTRWTVALSALFRRQTNRLSVVDDGATYTHIGVSDEGLHYPFPPLEVLDAYSRDPATFGLDQYRLTHPDGWRSDFDGLDASLQLRSTHAVLAFGATAARAFATLPGRGFRATENDPSLLDLAGNPNTLVNAEGRPFSDRGYTGKVAAVVNLPWRSKVGTLIRYQDGQPFSRLADVGELNQGPEPIRAYPPGKTRFTFVGTVDMRFQKDIGTVQRGAIVFLDVFNLFDTEREVEELVSTSPMFRSTSAVVPPRSVRVGIRLRF